MQVDYSLLNRAPEQAFLPYCQEHGIAVMVRGPLSKGLLSGRYAQGSVFTDSVRASWNAGGAQQAEFETRATQVGRLSEVVSPGEEMVQAAIRYTFSHPAVSLSIPRRKVARTGTDKRRGGQQGIDRDGGGALARSYWRIAPVWPGVAPSLRLRFVLGQPKRRAPASLEPEQVNM